MSSPYMGRPLEVVRFKDSWELKERPAQSDFFFLIKKHQMNLSLARPQQRNQAGSEPNLHGWAELGLGPGSFGTLGSTKAHLQTCSSWLGEKVTLLETPRVF